MEDTWILDTRQNRVGTPAFGDRTRGGACITSNDFRANCVPFADTKSGRSRIEGNSSDTVRKRMQRPIRCRGISVVSRSVVGAVFRWLFLRLHCVSIQIICMCRADFN